MVIMRIKLITMQSSEKFSFLIVECFLEETNTIIKISFQKSFNIKWLRSHFNALILNVIIKSQYTMAFTILYTMNVFLYSYSPDTLLFITYVLGKMFLKAIKISD